MEPRYLIFPSIRYSSFGLAPWAATSVARLLGAGLRSTLCSVTPYIAVEADDVVDLEDSRAGYTAVGFWTTPRISYLPG